LATAARPRIGDFDPENLANTAWALATAGQKDASLFASLAAAVQLQIGVFKPLEVANTAWAFATASQKDASLFAALAIAAHWQTGDFNSKDFDVHLKACWTSLGRLAEQPAERFWQQKSVGALEPLVHHKVLAANTGELGARELSAKEGALFVKLALTLSILGVRRLCVV